MYISLASPANATQKYLYRTKLDGKGPAERVSPANQEGTHEYDLSPTATIAQHIFSNIATAFYRGDDQLTLDHKGLNGAHEVNDASC